MKIYWKYGKEINVLLYIDRIIFIKIHIHVQELAWSRVLCQSLLAGEGERWSRRGRQLLSPPTRDGVRPRRSRAACPRAAVGQDGGVLSSAVPHGSGGISPGTDGSVEGAELCPTRMSWLQDEFSPSRGEQTAAEACPCHHAGPLAAGAGSWLRHCCLMYNY